MDVTFERLRTTEFSRLDDLDHVYLDYTGSGLYAESQVRDHAKHLLHTVMGNPHSLNPSSLESSKFVDEARERIRRFFDADEYEVVFTLNATGALKLVGESYPFDRKGNFVLTADNHNSVNGIREFAKRRGARIKYVPLNSELRVESIEDYLGDSFETDRGLFAYPAQSNFSGVKHPLDWIEAAHQKGYDVLLDAAAYVPTNRLSLKETKADFVPISFYKMFGFPSGVGALLATPEALMELRRPWFSGGTIRYVSTPNDVHLFMDGPGAFEDGTINFLGISAISRGLDFLESIGMERLTKHVKELTKLILDELSSLKHSNGEPLAKIYGPKTIDSRGGTIAFNVLDQFGKEFATEKVAEQAILRNISIRTGCFCNPGAAEFAFGHEPNRARKCYESMPHDKFNMQDFSSCMDGKPVGAVRASLGIASNEHDVERLTEMIKQFRDIEAGQACPPHLFKSHADRI
jgi:molybdenum cofactor sulfurtransferase